MKHGKYWVNQLETSECGLACIASILKMLGSNVEMHQLRGHLGSSSSGLTMKKLMHMCRMLNLRARPVKCELDELRMLRAPSILHWDFNHYVVLVGVSRGRVDILDPAVGARSIPLADAGRHFTGVALEVEPDEFFRKEVKSERLRLRELFRLTQDAKPALVAAVLLTFVGQLLFLTGPIYMQLAVDRAATGGDFALLRTLAIGFCLLALFTAGADALRAIAINQFSIILGWDASVKFFNKMMRLPLLWFGKRRLSDVLARFDSLDSIRAVFSQVMISSGLDGVFLILLLLLMLFISPKLALYTVGAFLIVCGLRLAMQRHAVRLAAESFSSSIEERSKRIDAFKAIQTIKLNAAEKEFELKWKNAFALAMRRQQSETFLQIGLGSVRGFVESASLILIVYLGATQISASKISIGALFAFVAYRGQFLARASALLEAWVQWRMLSIYSDGLADVVRTEGENLGPVVPLEGEIADLDCIEFRDVCFRYDLDEEPTLQLANFKFLRGDTIALRGKSGSGKTTLLRLITGLYQPSSGEIRINNQPLARFGTARMRSRCGVVLQDDDVLPGTIAENVSFFSSDQHRARIVSCLQEAQIWNDVRRFPLGLNTFLGEGGLNLSAGQKQRLLIARALYHEPSVLILDEATANVDEDCERRIIDALKKRGVMIVFVSHRSSISLAASRVYDLTKGRLVEVVDAQQNVSML